MRPSIKARALQALRRADERVSDETGNLYGGKGQLDWYPIHPGTINGTIGPVPVRDDGNGHLRNADNRAVADIDYVTGKIELEPTFQLFRCAGFKVSYFFDPDKKTPVHINMRLVTMPIVARTRKLRVRWAPDTEQEQEFMRRFANVKLNKKYYKKVVIRGKPNRNANKARRHGSGRRAGRA